MNSRTFYISGLSAFVQYYDYHLFGFLAAKISKYFIPFNTNSSQLLNTYLIMTIAMMTKPIGAIVLGRMGDLYGRSNSFSLSVLGAAIASLIISLIPSYEYWGLCSAFILLVARMIICALVSAGTDGVRIYIYEHINKNHQCLGIGLTSIFTQGGAFAAALSAWFFTQDFLPDYSWRGSFLLGSILGLIVLILKQNFNIKDINLTATHSNYDDFKNLSIIQIFKKNKKLFLRSIIISGVVGSTTQFYIIFFGTYNFEILKTISPSQMQFFTSVSIIIYMIFSLVAGYVVDRTDRFKTCMIAIIILMILSFCHIYVLAENNFNMVLLFLTTATLPFLTMPVAGILKESIPVIIRYRVFSLAHAIGSICISAPTAYISALLYYKTGITWLPIIYFIGTILMISWALINYKRNKF